MNPSSANIPMHDIAPALEIQEYSIVWFLVLTVCVLAVSFVFLKKMRLRENFKEVDARQQHYDSLIHVDVTDPKKAAYAICEEGSFFARDNEQMQSAYKTLFERLAPYKYAPKVELIDEESLALYHSYCQMIIV